MDQRGTHPGDEVRRQAGDPGVRAEAAAEAGGAAGQEPGLTYPRVLAVAFTVYAAPVAQPRATATKIHGHARVYTKGNHPIHGYKSAVQHAFLAARGLGFVPFTGPVRMDMRFVLPRPKGMIWKRKPMPRIRHTSTPDIDNLSKAVGDALTGLAYKDDCQVCCGEAEKWIASGDESPHVVISIQEVRDG